MTHSERLACKLCVILCPGMKLRCHLCPPTLLAGACVHGCWSYLGRTSVMSFNLCALWPRCSPIRPACCCQVTCSETSILSCSRWRRPYLHLAPTPARQRSVIDNPQAAAPARQLCSLLDKTARPSPLLRVPPNSLRRMLCQRRSPVRAVVQMVDGLQEARLLARVLYHLNQSRL